MNKLLITIVMIYTVITAILGVYTLFGGKTYQLAPSHKTSNTAPFNDNGANLNFAQQPVRVMEGTK